MEVNIDTEAIQEAIVRAVADSTIGEKIKENINKVLTEKQGYNHESILDEAIKSEVKCIICLAVKEEIEKKKEDIRKAITPMITDEALLKMSSAVIEVMLGNLDKH